MLRSLFSSVLFVECLWKTAFASTQGNVGNVRTVRIPGFFADCEKKKMLFHSTLTLPQSSSPSSYKPWSQDALLLCIPFTFVLELHSGEAAASAPTEAQFHTLPLPSQNSRRDNIKQESSCELPQRTRGTWCTWWVKPLSGREVGYVL